MRSLQDLRGLFDTGRRLFVGDVIDLDEDWSEDGSITIAVQRCFAYDGVVRLGVVEDYQCGIFPRI